MRHETITLTADGFDARLVTYLLDASEDLPASQRRPLVLICPGGCVHADLRPGG